MEMKESVHKYRSKRSFTNGTHSLLKGADASDSAHIIYLLYDAYR